MPATAATPLEHSVLLVEEYDALAVAIESALKKFAPQHRVQVVRSLAEARSLAPAQKPELIILDFDPPHPGAIAFFEQLRSALPETRVLLIAAGTPRQLSAERGSTGALQFLEKPFELVDFGAAVQALLGPWQDTGTSRGTVRDFALVDAIALGCLAGGDAIIQVQAAEERNGQLHLHNGHISHAATADKQGESALVEMLCWNNATFTGMPRVGTARHTIHGPWTATLLQALQEARKRAPAAPAAPARDVQPASAVKTGPKILIIDDTDMLLIFVEDSLTLADPSLQINSAPTGLDGVKEAARIVPDLVLCDYSLPDIKGDEVCRRIGANERTTRVPIIMMSGHVHEMTAAAVKLPNVVATIAKPFLSEALVTLVQQTLKEGGLRDRAKPSAEKAEAPPPLPRAAPQKKAARKTLQPAPVSEFLEPAIAAESGQAGARTSPAVPPLSPNELLLDVPLEVVSMEVNSSFQVGSIRARPASATVAIQIPALAARAALPLETGFQLGPVDLDASGCLSIVRLIPTTQPFRQVETRTAFAIGGVTVVPANERERLQLISSGTSSMTMQLFAPVELLSVEFTANLEVRQLVLHCRGSAVRVTMNAQTSQAHSGATFKTTSVQMDETRHIRELTLAPLS